MELVDYLRMLRKRWLSILLVTVAGLVAGLGASVATTPTYSASAQVFVSVRGSATTSDLLQGSDFTVRQVQSYKQLVQTPRVLEPVIAALGLTETPSDLARRVSAESPLDTVLIDLTAVDESPRLAAAIANAVAGSLASVVAEVEMPVNGTESPVQVSTVRPATTPEAPSAPNTTLNLALGLLVGLALGVGIAVLREVLDTKVRDVADVTALTEAPVLGTIPHQTDVATRPLITQEPVGSPRAEAFRRLRTNLQFLEVDQNAKTIVVTSSLPDEGKSTTSINLALTLADTGARVALVDADLRRPSVATFLGLEGSVGLTTLLIGRAHIDDAVQPWSSNLDVITSGQVPPNPSELLGSDRMRDLVDTLAERYDAVIIDSPPLLPVTDAAILARLTDGAIVVVRAGATRKAELQESLHLLTTAHARALGTIVNHLPTHGAHRRTYYEYASQQAGDQPATCGDAVLDAGPPASAGSPRSTDPGKARIGA